MKTPRSGSDGSELAEDPRISRRSTRGECEWRKSLVRVAVVWRSDMELKGGQKGKRKRKTEKRDGIGITIPKDSIVSYGAKDRGEKDGLSLGTFQPN